MRPDRAIAFREALLRGPGYCPADLFEGCVPAIVRGLKVHANNISHARHVALEETYPRLVRAMGLEAFHEAAERFLAQSFVWSRGLDALGEGFEQVLGDPVHRDIARVEWAWLEAFHAADAEALTLEKLAALEPDKLLGARLSLHPATRWLKLELADEFEWDSSAPCNGDVVHLSRPGADVSVRRLDAEPASLLPLISNSCPVAQLLGTDLTALIALVDAGTVILETHHEA
jgi:hypothetical protein